MSVSETFPGRAPVVLHDTDPHLLVCSNRKGMDLQVTHSTHNIGLQLLAGDEEVGGGAGLGAEPAAGEARHDRQLCPGHRQPHSQWGLGPEGRLLGEESSRNLS